SGSSLPPDGAGEPASNRSNRFFAPAAPIALDKRDRGGRPPCARKIGTRWLIHLVPAVWRAWFAKSYRIRQGKSNVGPRERQRSPPKPVAVSACPYADRRGCQPTANSRFQP